MINLKTKKITAEITREIKIKVKFSTILINTLYYQFNISSQNLFFIFFNDIIIPKIIVERTIPIPTNQPSENRAKFVIKITPTRNIMTIVSEKITIFFANYFNSFLKSTYFQ